MKLPFSFSHRDSRVEAAKPVDPVEGVLTYHEETKHHVHRYARSLGYLDWDTQPDPFRRFEGAPAVPLPLLPLAAEPSYADCLAPGQVSPCSVTLESLSRFLRNSLAISAWKRYGDSHWALRVNPSSGNLHPTEGYLVMPEISEQLGSGVYHYRPREHWLEKRAVLENEIVRDMLVSFPEGTFLAGLTSIHWREAWKYGERAYRYCQHDIGHALGALRISAAILGWQLVLLEELADSDISTLLGLERAIDFDEAEDEAPDLVVAVIPSSESISTTAQLDYEALMQLRNATWQGKANRLSENHVEWEIIDRVHEFGNKPRTASVSRAAKDAMPVILTGSMAAERILQQRRSAVSLDGETSISADTFYRILLRTLPNRNPLLFDVLQRSELSPPRVHLALFVHRVTDLEPGLYILLRDPSKEAGFRQALDSDFQWTHHGPQDLPLFCLRPGNLQRLAAGVSCGQDIAGDGAFSLGMIAEFEEAIRTTGAWLYRRLFWEAGLIGQMLYLDAEAAGIRATGIGCYFDDPMHEILGLKDRKFQSLYHFTMGGPVEDTRITTEPAY